ncbi:MAG: protein kinase [Planctomycetes bacterium]|nr:protein kinase [Planctomycetota bacterium]MCW8134359.1 protein kinase [Planctomycetota bacterium]
MRELSRGVIAAVLAVREGRLTPEQAAELIAAGQAEYLPEADEFDGGTVAIAPGLVDAIAERLRNGKGLDDLKVDSGVASAIAVLRGANGDTASIRDTLLSISPTRHVAPDDDLYEMIDAAQQRDSNQPTHRPKDAVTTKKPSSQILRAVARDERYTIEKEHARGGMGRILIARDNVVGRDVALKELLPSRRAGASTPGNTEISRGLTERFLREAKVTGQLEHPNIVSVYEIGKNEDDSLYYTMRFVRGVTLATRLTEIERDPSLNKKEKFAARLKLLDNFVDVCNALAFAHSKGVVHRDLKPENVMIGEYGETVVLDWGLARVRGQEDTVRDQLAASTRYLSQSIVAKDSEQLTLDGSIVGTPAYMAPEQARGELDEIDEQSDVYALGCVLYQILSGRPPFEAPVAALIIQQVVHSKPLRLSAIAPDVPPELNALVERAMAKEKSERLKSAREFASEIKAFRDGRTISSYSYSTRELVARWVHRNKKGVIAAMAVFWLLISGAVWHYMSLRSEREESDRQRASAEMSRRDAELAYQEARIAERSARDQKTRAEDQAAEARTAQRKAEQAEEAARNETAAKQRALEGWDQTLADAYAMRIRLATRERDHNGALAFAAAALRASEQPEARGAIMAWDGVLPQLWHFPGNIGRIPEIFEFYPVRYTPDGRFIVTGMPDGHVLFYDIRSGETAARFRVQPSNVLSVALHPAGTELAIGNMRGQVMTFDLDPSTGLPREEGFRYAELGRGVGGLAYSPDGETLAACEERIHLFATRGLRKVGVCEEKAGSVYVNLAFSPDGLTLLAASPMLDDLFVRVFDLRTRKLVRTLVSLDASNETFTAWSPDGSKVACCTMQGEVRIRDGSTLNVLHTLKLHTSLAVNAAFSPDGRYLLTSSTDGTLRLWDFTLGHERAVLGGFDSWPTSVAFSPDGREFCARTADGDVRVWALPAADESAITTHTMDVMDVRYSPGGNRVLTASWDGSVILWEAATRRQLRRFSVLMARFFSADFLDEDRVVAAGTSGVYVWNATTGEQLAHLNNGDICLDVAVCRAAGTFAYAHYRQAHIIDAATYKEVRQVGRHSQYVMGTDLSPDGSLCVTCANDGSVRVSRVSDGAVTHEFSLQGGYAFGVRFSPNGALFATAATNRLVELFETATATPVRALAGHDGAVFAARFSPDGRYVVSASQDRTLRIWRTVDGAPLAVLKGHTETVTRAAVSPDGATMISGSQDDSVRVWSLASLEEDRANLIRRVEGATGLVVPEKEFRARTAPGWPGGGVPPVLGAARARRSAEITRHGLERELAFEGWRYADTQQDGHAVRRYFPARPRAEVKTPHPGEVNFAGWWAQRHPQWSGHLRRPVLRITEVAEGGAAHSAGLAVGDVLLSVAGKPVGNRDELRAALSGVEGRFEVKLRRYRRDEAGNPQPMQVAPGVLLLNDGKTSWDYEELALTLDTSSLGIRAADEEMPARPYR